MKEKLKPCPFCGGEAICSEREEPECYEPNYYYVGYDVSCLNCPALIIFYDSSAPRKETELEAIKAWNRRPQK